jgi:drug/metabolite transporter (DMT)-like permease
MIKFLLIPIGIAASALAQVLLKKAAVFSFSDALFYVYFCCAGLSYVVSFGLYAVILKYFPISKISPVMTLGTMALVLATGVLFFKEIITVKQIIGIALGIIAILLIII